MSTSAITGHDRSERRGAILTCSRLRAAPKLLLSVVALASALILGCTGSPEFNPRPAVSVSPSEASPTAAVTGGPPATSPDAVTPAPTPPLFIFEPTFQPPSPILDPAGYVMASLRQFDLRESMTIRSSVTLDAAAAGEPAPSIRVEGEYSISDVPLVWEGFPVRQIPYPGFHLRFFHRPLGGEAPSGVDGETDGPPDAELEAVGGRFVRDTTGHNFKLHESFEELLADTYPGQRPNLAVFLSLALSGGRVLETALTSWLSFAPGDVRPMGMASLDGGQHRVFEASRSRLNGDFEEWTFWIGDNGLPRRIELAVSNERRPERNIRGAELEFLSIGNCIEGYVCGR